MRRFLRNNYIKIFLIIFFFSAVLFFMVFRTGQNRSLKINEVCTRNFSVSSDSSGHYRDYIEIVNTGNSDIYLSGYKIKAVRDRKSATWEFPGISVGAGEHRLIFSSSKYRAEDKGYDEDASLDIKEFLISGRFFKKDTEKELHADIDLSSEGCTVFLLSPAGEVLDLAEVPALSYDSTFSRFPDMNGNFSVRSATPEESNEGSEEIRQRTLKEPGFSIEGGFYDEPVTLSLSAGEGERIYYTLDGSDPDESSIPYTGPVELKNASDNDNVYSMIEDVAPVLTGETERYSFSLPSGKVDKAVVVRAAAVDGKGNLGKVRTESYFIGLDKDKYKNKAVISLVSDTDGLFGDERGIYVLGDIGKEYRKEHSSLYWGEANYRCRGRKWERESDIAVYNEGHELILKEKTGVRIRGNWSRAFPQKSLNLYARKIYSGSDFFSVNLLDGDKAESSLSLFSGGNDLNTKTLDRLASSLGEDLNITVMHYRPAHLFLNGEYWGIMYITDKYTNEFLSDRYGANPENIVLIKDNQVEGGSEDNRKYYEELRYMAYSGLKDGEAFKRFSEAVDIDSMTDYYAFEIYIGAMLDWPTRNVALWRSVEKGGSAFEDCKWRYMLFDVNHETMNASRVDKDNLEMALKDDAVFAAAFENESFRKLFFEKLKDMEKVFCTPEKANEKIDEIASDMRSSMMLWYDRFYSSIDKETYYDDKITDLKTFFDERPAAIERLIEKYNGTEK